MKSLYAETSIFSLPEPTDRMGILMHLERIGRICYKSEDRITEDSCIKFIKNIRDRKHWAMLEHYRFTFSVPKLIYDNIINPQWLTIDNPDLIHAIKYINTTYWPDAPDEDLKYIVSGSATAFNYLWKCKCFKDTPYAGIVNLCHFLASIVPEIMMDPYQHTLRMNTDIKLLSRDRVKSLPPNLRILHDFMSVLFITDRGVSHELVRHRPFSFAQESTRYCNYGGKDIKNIIPCWFSDEAKESLSNGSIPMRFTSPPVYPFEKMDENIWYQAMLFNENSYDRMVKYGNSPQQARSVLPNSSKTEIVLTGDLQEWIHFFTLRVEKVAHPQMREVSIPLLNEFKSIIPILFDHIIPD